jgi:hypothetical protein
MNAPPVSVCPYASTRLTPHICHSAAVSCGRGAAPDIASSNLSIYILSLLAMPFLPDTKGKPLPE